MSEQAQPRPGIGLRALRFLAGLIFGVILPLAVLAGGVYGAVRLMETAPTAERNGAKPEARARLVEATPLDAGSQQIVVEAMGTVTAARRVAIQPLVGGEIEEVHPNLDQGGFVAEGEVLARVEPADYELEVERARAEVQRMRSALDIELGQQEVAREEFELLGADIDETQRRLVLREPQLRSARADLAQAETQLRSARLNLDRTAIRAPFNALVDTETAEVGGIARVGSTLAELVGTDRFWVELSVPVDNLRWIELPEPGGEGGSLVKLYDRTAWGPGQYREGRVIRYAANLDEESRMARLLIGVEDPLAMREENRGKPKLLLGSYLTGMIYGSEVRDVIALPRQHLRENDSVWVMNDEGRLEIRTVSIVWRGKREVYVSGGLGDGEWIVTSNLSAPVEGMRLRVEGESPVQLENPEQSEEEATRVSQASST